MLFVHKAFYFICISVFASRLSPVPVFICYVHVVSFVCWIFRRTQFAIQGKEKHFTSMKSFITQTFKTKGVTGEIEIGR